LSKGTQEEQGWRATRRALAARRAGDEPGKAEEVSVDAPRGAPRGNGTFEINQGACFTLLILAANQDTRSRMSKALVCIAPQSRYTLRNHFASFVFFVKIGGGVIVRVFFTMSPHRSHSWTFLLMVGHVKMNFFKSCGGVVELIGGPALAFPIN